MSNEHLLSKTKQDISCGRMAMANILTLTLWESLLGQLADRELQISGGA